MKKEAIILIIILLSSITLAELKPSYDIPMKLTAEEQRDGPKLSQNTIYPQWGVPCTNFTYNVVYTDEKGRPPTYIRINLNGKWYDMNHIKGDYKTGALYTYNYVPTSTKANFFYFEASNGAGRARAAIIDSPDQGPILYSEKFDNNQIILLDKEGGEMWTYDTGKDMVEGIAISKDGNYIAAVTNFNIYLFSKNSNQPIWKYCQMCTVPEMVSSNFAGIAISADGKYIAANMQQKTLFFERESNKPKWSSPTESSAIGVDMSDDGSIIAVGIANLNGRGDKIIVYDKEGKKLWEYKAEHPSYEQTGNFYKPDVTPDGKHIAVSTGCPDRRAYMFTAEGEGLFRSEQLTYDSPIHKSAIADNGELAAYSADHMQGKEILFLFNKKGEKQWGFSSLQDSTARAVSISADGQYIAIGTSAGNIYLFNKNSNKPIWKFTEKGSQIGEVKLNREGTLLAAGGTSKKIYMFGRESSTPKWQYTANTWITKLDFNGQYVAAGTGLREYMGEGIPEEKIFTCTEIIQPKTMEEMQEGIQQDGDEVQEAVCGDGICIPSKERGSCPQDCIPLGEETIEEKETTCGNGICEQPEENRENCMEDCTPIKDEEEEPIREEKGFFARIIEFLRNLF